MSSIRLFILGSLSQHGELHGHQLRLLAEEERVHMWTDISVGAIYGAIKRMAADGLIDVVRTEREGGYPERQVYAISMSGRRALDEERREGLEQVHLKPDPFDLALTRLDRTRLDDLQPVLEGRLVALKNVLADALAAHQRAAPHVTVSESWALDHRTHRIRAEISWLEALLAGLPELVADERARHGNPDPLPESSPRSPNTG
ncbi:PadR family transcriptional regulator [Subtercola frigoramans]|uniref:DNA-binding PadR family transcriptional regulator n=1 Tax=Subtercola frigoramans TaxID=120298 RepID=A0ABS2L783_9MICO|nr:PadR family transcriptional regulator [Subtercola frigoramans]MBM7472960.1 DNA-binding PadR family transcriptional regulator [Subtercola frigoramans]